MSAYGDLLISLGPSLYWPLDSTDGATDQSGNGRNGTAFGPTIGGHVATAPPILGADASCTDFDGTDDYVSVTYVPFVNSAAQTFMGWSYRDDQVGYHTLIAGNNSSDGPLLYLPTGSNNVEFFPDVGSLEKVWSGAYPGSAQWVFWTLVFDESTNDLSLYFNGALYNATTLATAWAGTPTAFKIAAWGSGASSPFNGKMGHVAIVPTALTAQNIADLYTYAISGAPVAPTNIIPDIVSAPALR